MRSGNPALGDKVFRDFGPIRGRENTMTVQGTVNKTFLLTFCVLLTAAWTWGLFYATSNPAVVMPWLIGGAIGGLIVALVIIFKKTWAPMLAPIYALLEGCVIGGLSAILEAEFPGIAIQAASMTIGILFFMLFMYKTGLIKATEKFKFGVIIATGGIFVVYLISFILSFFSISVPFIYSSGWIGIGFSLFVVIIATLNLVLDFDLIETASANGAPKYMEWYGAFALMVTLIWLYIEILRLLSKLRSR